MSTEVMAIVLFSALLHAGWNALVRASADKFLASLHVVCGAGGFALLLLPGLPLPAAASWPWLLASALIHVVYFTLVARAYHRADLGLAYPLMRGLAPVLTALAAALLLGEWPGAGGWLGVALICGGVLILAAHARRHGPQHAGTLWIALANAAVIALYTLVDGMGVRQSGHAVSYTGWVFLLTAVFMLLMAARTRGRSLLHPPAGAWRTALLGGGGTLAAYGLVLWAMTVAPIALVSALRESSIVFAALIGTLFLGERLSRQRAYSALLVCAGVVALKLA